MTTTAELYADLALREAHEVSATYERLATALGDSALFRRMATARTAVRGLAGRDRPRDGGY